MTLNPNRDTAPVIPAALPFGIDRSYGAGTTFALVLAWHYLDRMSCPWTDLVLMPNGVMCDTCGWRAVDEDLLQPVVGTTEAETSREILCISGECGRCETCQAKAKRHQEHYRSCGCLGSGSVCCDPSCCGQPSDELPANGSSGERQ